jgi:hypothetical protein
MDHADRIPIDLGYEVAAAAREADQRVMRKPDGTLVVNILVPQPCAPSADEEIVVCGPSEIDEQQRLADTPAPPQKNLTDKIGEALHAKIGPLELGSMANPDGTRSFGARVRF